MAGGSKMGAKVAHERLGRREQRDPGLGKTWVCPYSTIAAIVSTGSPFPSLDWTPGERRPPADVLYLTAENKRKNANYEEDGISQRSITTGKGLTLVLGR